MPRKKPKYYDLEAHVAERHGGIGSRMGDIILGAQDGIVNVLGIVLGMVAATGDVKTIIIASMAATFAESFSMAAVAYTSAKADVNYYYSQREKEKQEIEKESEDEKKEVYEVYHRKGFEGKLLDDIVAHMTSSKERMIDFMMKEELMLTEPEKGEELKQAFIVGFAALIGSFIPMLPFLLPGLASLPTETNGILAIVFSTLVLFGIGYYKAKVTIGSPLKSGIELAVIGMAAAFIGYLTGFAVNSLL